ncbi:MAG: AraC family transcriptional regulator [Rhizobacter sp.]
MTDIDTSAVSPEADSPSSTLLDKRDSFALAYGNVFARYGMALKNTTRRSVSIFIAVDRKPFDLVLGDTNQSLHAVVVGPLVKHTVRGNREGGVIGFLITPHHPLYRSFRDLPPSGAQPVPRTSFTSLVRRFEQVLKKEADQCFAEALFDDAVLAAAGCFPDPGPLDPRVGAAMQLIDGDPRRSLSELAQEVEMSYHRLSHCFSQQLGLSMRSYQLWRKFHKAADMLLRGEPLVASARECGFTSVQHLCRVFREVYGAPPSIIYQGARARRVPADQVATADDEA